MILSVDVTELRMLLRRGAHGLLDLRVGEASESVVIKDLQYDALGTEIYHVDFARVSADERVTVTVPIVLKGDAPGVKNGGLLNHALREIEIECLASNLVQQIVVDVSEMQLDDALTVGDLPLPEGMKAISDPTAVVAQVALPRGEKEEEPAEGAGGAEPEVIKREAKPEDDEE